MKDHRIRSAHRDESRQESPSALHTANKCADLQGHVIIYSCSKDFYNLAHIAWKGILNPPYICDPRELTATALSQTRQKIQEHD